MKCFRRSLVQAIYELHLPVHPVPCNLVCLVCQLWFLDAIASLGVVELLAKGLRE